MGIISLLLISSVMEIDKLCNILHSLEQWLITKHQTGSKQWPYRRLLLPGAIKKWRLFLEIPFSHILLIKTSFLQFKSFLISATFFTVKQAPKTTLNCEPDKGSLAFAQHYVTIQPTCFTVYG